MLRMLEIKGQYKWRLKKIERLITLNWSINSFYSKDSNNRLEH